MCKRGTPLYTTTLTLFFLFAALTGLSHAQEVVRVNGSGIALDMMKPLAKAFEAANPGIRVQMERPLGSSGAVKALTAGALDLVVSSKKLTPEQSAQGAMSAEFGRTPLAIVVQPDLPVSSVTTSDLEAIYSGTKTSWPNGERVRVVMRPESDIDTMILRGLSPGVSEAIDKAKASPGMLMAVTDPESNEAVSKTPGAVGASGLPGVLHGESRVKVVALNGTMPTVQNLADGKYSLSKDIRFVFLPNASSGVKALLAFAESTQGRAIAEKAGVLVVAGAATSK